MLCYEQKTFVELKEKVIDMVYFAFALGYAGKTVAQITVCLDENQLYNELSLMKLRKLRMIPNFASC